ncbi:hypothetical protein V8G54_003253 [Vigna mungo]|uniref:Integrase catalytic domain-containing protein n=1 Tax=Vigna mungo TaxID=3915 RepID=A0AAQ3SDY3_VIGMU
MWDFELQTREALKQLRFHLTRAQDTKILRAIPSCTSREVAFKLQLPDTARIHPIFHVSQLKKAVGEKIVEKELPTELQIEGPTFWPIKILDSRQTQQGEEGVEILRGGGRINVLIVLGVRRGRKLGCVSWGLEGHFWKFWCLNRLASLVGGRLGSLVAPFFCDEKMEKVVEARFEKMEKVTEAQFEAIEITVGGMQVELAAVRRDLQQIMKMLEKRENSTESSFDDSSVNDNRHRRNGETGGSGSGERNGEQKPWRKRVELPTFEGEEPLKCVDRITFILCRENLTLLEVVTTIGFPIQEPIRFFDIQKVTDDEEKVEIAYISMEGSAAYCNRTWEGLKEAMINHFGGGFRGTVFERLATLSQEGTVEEFVRQFEVLMGQTKGIPEVQVMGYFLASLREDVKGQVRIQNPSTLMEAMRIARDVEDAMMRVQGCHASGSKMTPIGSRSSGMVTRSEPPLTMVQQPGRVESVGSTRREGAMPNANTKGSNAAGSDNRGRMVRNLPYPEFLKRKEEGLCFRCGGPFAPGHRCTERSLRVLLLAEDEEGEEGEVVGDHDEKPLELSACSAEGLTTSRTLKLMGKIGERSVVVLIDSGASHNYISKKVMKELGLPVIDTTPYTVSLGDGHRRMTQGRCEGVKVRLEEVEVEEEFHVFELGAIDVILGVAWLAKLGEVRTNWGKMTMEYVVGDKKIKIRGEPALSRQLVKPESLRKMTDAESWALVWDLSIVEDRGSDEWEADLTVESTTDCFKSWALVWDLSIVEDRGSGEWEADLTAEQEVALEAVLQKHYRLFRDLHGLPPPRDKQHCIQLKEGIDPINVRPYRYPHTLKNEIEKQVADMLKAGIICPSSSPFSSPVILVKKKDGSWRFCANYRALNKATVPEKFPIELLDELRGARYFSKIDLKSGYHQIRMKEDDVAKTAFRTHLGHFEFLVMPLASRMHRQPSKQYLRKWVLVFFDDILVYSPSWEDHLKQLSLVMQLLEQKGWVANQKKCDFGKRRIHYLGHQISGKGVEMDSDKIKTVVEWGEPRTLKALRGFLGLTGYYRRFVAGYGKIVQPLTELLKKGKFVWSDQARSAMEKLKADITSAPVLTLPDFNQEFQIECDASRGGVGAVLTQNKKPIAFFSKALSRGSLSKPIYEKELMALVLAIQHWRPYLVGRRFTVYTDQRSLRYLLEQRITTQNQQNWLAKLMGYEFGIVYKKGSTNRAADALSRKHEGEHEGGELRAISRPFWPDFQEILKEVEEDTELQKVIENLRNDPNSKGAYTLENDRLHFKGRLVIFAKSIWIPKLLEEFHVTKTGGHSVCQRYKYVTASPQGLLQPLPIPQAVWEDISLDFIVRPPKSQGYDAIIVVVDRLMADVFAKEVIRLHGIPVSVVSDRDPLFLSIFWKELFKMQGTQLKMSTSYHPETDGQTEVVNRIVEGYLRCFCSEQPKSWYLMLSWAEIWYNTSYQGAAKCTPFEIVYGRPPPSFSRYIPGETQVEAVAQDLMTRDEVLKQLKHHLRHAQDLMTQQANKRRREVDIKVGDWVYLKIRPHQQSSMLVRLHPKLSARYFGPFKVLQQVGNVAFRLELPEAARIHPVFHASQLKKAVGDQIVEKGLPEELQAEGPAFWPIKVLERRQLQQGEDMIQTGGIEGATWEDLATIKDQFPEFNFEDKVENGGGGNDRKLKVYVRKKRG